jgi:hypothetical protein
MVVQQHWCAGFSVDICTHLDPRITQIEVELIIDLPAMQEDIINIRFVTAPFSPKE